MIITKLQYWVATGWCLAIGGGLGVVYGVNFSNFYNGGREKSPAENAIYQGVHKYVWGLSCGWVIFAGAKGYGGKFKLIRSEELIN